ncbi:hypothetical protein, partial [Raoultella sp. 18112]|uniref:hypothetical protein n=1 Tax=Raoultella sp. 18112 TaxID=2681444 RepID=UPI00190F40B9
LTVVDGTAPTLGPITLGSNGTTYTAALSESGCTVSGPGGWTIAGVTITAAGIVGTTLTLTGSPAKYAGGDFAVAYAGGTIADAAGNALGAFSGTVDNGSAVALPDIVPDESDVRDGVAYRVDGVDYE